MISFFVRYRRFFIALFHGAAIAAALVAAFVLRFDFDIPDASFALLVRGLGLAVVLKMVAFHVVKLHRGWWRPADIRDLARVFVGNLAGSVAFSIGARLWMGPKFPRSVYVIDFLICFLVTGGARYILRLYHEALWMSGSRRGDGRKGLLIYGAGSAGALMVREIQSNPHLPYEIVGFLDDDPRKVGTVRMGARVLGVGRAAAQVIDRYKNRSVPVDEIIIAMPSASGRQMREALANCRATGVTCKTIPGISEILDGKVLTSQIRDLSPNDLLGREPVRLEEGRIRENIDGKSVLITGAAGSIGSELCRQVAQYMPVRLVAFDQAESELFKIDLELRKRFPDLEIVCEIGDIRDLQRVSNLIRRYSIDSVFHAAAYKHVPMMEAHVLEAVRNNVIGTWNVAQAAQRNGVSKFLMVSTDKAVNPVNIMGVTKRAAELIVSAMHEGSSKGGTQYVSVRFGNVLGSNGSVVPIFQAQIAAGGPVTVTHPEIRRYFMTVREAVQLVLQASTMGKGSEVFILDMGEPIKIVDLARNMIRLAGFAPDEEIEIRYTGLRPGEKLYEELITEGENIRPTYHEKIKIFQGPPVAKESIDRWLAEVKVLLERRDEAAVVTRLQELVPEYQPSRIWSEPAAGTTKPEPRPAANVTPITAGKGVRDRGTA